MPSPKKWPGPGGARREKLALDMRAVATSMDESASLFSASGDAVMAQSARQTATMLRNGVFMLEAHQNALNRAGGID